MRRDVSGVSVLPVRFEGGATLLELYGEFFLQDQQEAE